VMKANANITDAVNDGVIGEDVFKRILDNDFLSADIEHKVKFLKAVNEAVIQEVLPSAVIDMLTSANMSDGTISEDDMSTWTASVLTLPTPVSFDDVFKNFATGRMSTGKKSKKKKKTGKKTKKSESKSLSIAGYDALDIAVGVGLVTAGGFAAYAAYEYLTDGDDTVIIDDTSMNAFM